MTIASAEVVVIAGAHVTCPQCHAAIGVTVQTLNQGYNWGMDAIRFEKGQEPRLGSASCRKCGSAYAEQDIHTSGNRRVTTMLIHTAHGWLPRPPPDAPAPERAPIVDESKIR